MATLSSLASDIQPLSNLESVDVASGVDWCEVSITVGTNKFFDEKLYAGSDNKVTMYDLRSLLMPYSQAGGITTFVFKTKTATGTEATVNVKVIYCTAKIVRMKPGGKTMRNMICATWLSAASNRDIVDSAGGALYYMKETGETTSPVTCNALMRVSGKLYECNNISFDTDDLDDFVEIISDASDVCAAAKENLDHRGVPGDITHAKLVAYNFVLQRSGFSASTCRFNVVEKGCSDLLISFVNQWGFEEEVLLRGAQKREQEITLDSAYIGGYMQRINDRFVKSNTFVLPLATDEDLVMLEQIVGSKKISIYDDNNKRWLRYVVTGAEPTVSDIGSAENSYTITYQPVEPDHRTTSLVF